MEGAAVPGALDIFRRRAVISFFKFVTSCDSSAFFICGPEGTGATGGTSLRRELRKELAVSEVAT